MKARSERTQHMLKCNKYINSVTCNMVFWKVYQNNNTIAESITVPSRGNVVVTISYLCSPTQETTVLSALFRIPHTKEMGNDK